MGHLPRRKEVVHKLGLLRDAATCARPNRAKALPPMSTPKAAIPHFDDRNPWGAYKPSGGVAAALALAHVLPPTLAQLTK